MFFYKFAREMLSLTRTHSLPIRIKYFR